MTTNLLKTQTCVIRIFKIFHIFLQNFIARENSKRRRENHNKILQKHQIKIFHKFIKSLITYNIQSTKFLIFNAIQHLKRVENFESSNLNKRWFRSWWHFNNLYIIKIKSLTIIWYTAKQTSKIETWFEEYRMILKKLKIKNRRNIINFDEIEFRWNWISN